MEKAYGKERADILLKKYVPEPETQPFEYLNELESEKVWILLKDESIPVLELPGAADSSRINSIIMGKGILNIRHVDTDATNAFKEYYAANPGKTFASNGELLNPDVIPADTEVLGYYTKDDYGLDEFVSYMVVKKAVVLDGKYIKSAVVASDNITGKPEVHLTLDDEGAEIFGTFTTTRARATRTFLRL